MGSLATIEHRGEPRTAIHGMIEHLVRRDRGAINPQVFFVGPDTLTFAILKASHLGAWGAQLEGLMPEQPLEGLAFACHSIADFIDGDGVLHSTTEGHALWFTDGRRQETLFWPDNTRAGFQAVTDFRMEVAFLEWHLRELKAIPVNALAPSWLEQGR